MCDSSVLIFFTIFGGGWEASADLFFYFETICLRDLGLKWVEGSYREGELDGLITFWNVDGMLDRELLYGDGVMFEG